MEPTVRDRVLIPAREWSEDYVENSQMNPEKQCDDSNVYDRIFDEYIASKLGSRKALKLLAQLNELPMA